MDINEKTLFILGLGVFSLFVIFCAGIIAVSSYFGGSEPPKVVATHIITPTPKPTVSIVSNDGSMIYASGTNGSIDFIRTSDNARIRNTPVAKNNIVYLELINSESDLLIIDSAKDKYILNLTTRKAVLVTPTPEPSMIAEPSVIPTPVFTPRSTQDITSMNRFVVITTPTPVPVNRNIDLQVTCEPKYFIGKDAKFHVYLKTNDVAFHNILIRFNGSYMNQDHKLEGLGEYFSVNSNNLLSLPAHSQIERDFSYPINDIITIPGDNGEAKVYATLYQFRIDLIDMTDGSIVGSTFLNNVQVVREHSDGSFSFDW
jgi:hypothetical protein